MVRKLKELEASSDENAMVQAVCSSAHQIWQAGLGAFAKAQKEGGDMFGKLVQEGEELQKLTQRLTGDKGFGVADTVTKLAENVGKQATGSWEKLEKIFEDRVSRSLRSLGVPTQDDVKGLSRQIDELNKSIIALTRKSTAEKAPARKSPAKAATKAAMKRPPLKSTARTAAKKQARPAASQH